MPTFHQLVKQGRTPTRYKTASPALQGSRERGLPDRTPVRGPAAGGRPETAGARPPT